MPPRLLRPLIFIWLLAAALIATAIGVGYLLPAGNQLTYTKKSVVRGSQYSSIYLRDINRNLESRLTSPYGINAVAKWSPDGQKIAYLSLDSGQFHIYIMDALGKQVSPVGIDFTLSDSGIWSPDSQKILDSVIAQGQVQSVIINLATGLTDMLPQPLTSAVWSPDSQYLMYQAPTEDSTTHLYGMNINCFAQSKPCEFNELSFLKIQALYDNPVWSPDGHAIAFSQVDYATNILQVVVASLRCADLEQSCVERYTVVGKSPNSETPIWSADSQSLAFVSDISEITTIHLSDGQTRTFTIPTILSGLQSWSPDGKFLMYLSDSSVQFGMTTTYLLDVDQGISRVLFLDLITTQSPEWRPRPH